MRISRCGIQIIHYYSLRACRLASLDYHSAQRKLVKISRQIKELIFQNIIHHSSFLPRAPALLELPRTCHSRANAKNLVRHASVIITNASSVCLRQPPSPTGEGKLKRHCSAYYWLPCVTQAPNRSGIVSHIMAPLFNPNPKTSVAHFREPLGQELRCKR